MKISVAKLKERLEWGFTLLILQLCTGSLFVFMRPDPNSPDMITESPAMQVFWLVVYGISLGLILARPRQFIRVIKRDQFLLLLIGVAIFSYFWSTIPLTTLRRSIALTGTTFFGIYLATRYTHSQILKLVVWTLSIGAVLSVVFAVALPSYGIMSDGNWRGIYVHKNLMGRYMGLNAVLLLLVNSNNPRYRWLVWAGVALSTGLVLLSSSKGALVTSFSLLILLPLYKSLQWKYTKAVPFLIIVILVYASGAILILGNLETIVVDTLGKDLTFTGRTDLWELVIEMIKQRPLLGYGYHGFWRRYEGPSATVLLGANWAVPVPHSHNGLLDLWLDLGFVGVFVFLLGFVMSVTRAIIGLRSTKKVEDIWPLIIFACIFLYNLAESTLLKRNDFFWILYVVAVFSRPMQQNRARKGDYTSAISTPAN